MGTLLGLIVHAAMPGSARPCNKFKGLYRQPTLVKQ